MPATRWAEVYNRVHTGLNNRLRGVAGGRWAGSCHPVGIHLLLSERCNARCVHCDIWKNRGKEQGPTPDQWKAALRDLRSWLGPVHVIFTGGEALLMPHTVELAAYASSLGLLLEHFTHGYWLDQSRIEAVARTEPWRVTLSLDGIGEVHDRVRGRAHFFEATDASIQTLLRVRRELKRPYTIRLKTVVMEHNLHSVAEVAEYAKARDLEVVYQPIEQNYNTPIDPRWYEHSENFPKDPQKAVETVRRLIAMKQQGYPIANSEAQLNVMIPYFSNPAGLSATVQSQVAAAPRLACSAATIFQIQSNGDMKSCWDRPPIGNIKEAAIRQIWNNRPRYWESGCCLEQRITETEREYLASIGKTL